MTLRLSAYRERHFLGLDNDRFRLESCRLVVNVANHKYPGRGVTGVISLALTESNDIAQYLWKSCGRRKVVPKVSPGKRWKVWWGRNHYYDCVTDYWTVTDTAKYITGIISGFVNWY